MPGGSGQKAGTGQVWFYINGHLASGGVSTTWHWGTAGVHLGTYTLKAALVTNGKVVATSAPVVVTLVSASVPPTPVAPKASCATPPVPSTDLKAGTITLFCMGLPAGSEGSDLLPGPGGDLWFTMSAVAGGTGGIGQITPSGVITVFAKGLRPGGSPGGMIWLDGNLYFAETFPNGATGALGMVTPSGAITMFSAGLPAGSQIGNLVAGPDGNLWFTDCVQNASLSPPCSPAIGRVTPSGSITLFTRGMPVYSWPNGLVVGPDGNLWFSTTSNPMLGGSLAIGRITPTGVVTLFTKGLAAFNQLHGITVGPDANLWVSANPENGGPGAIGRVTPAGNITWFDGGLPPTALVSRVVSGPDRSVWFRVREPEPNGPNVRVALGRITSSGAITVYSKGLPTNSYLGNLVGGADGNMWFTVLLPGKQGSQPGAIGRITPSGVITLFTKGLAPVNQPQGLTVGPGGTLWFTVGTAIGRLIP